MRRTVKLEELAIDSKVKSESEVVQSCLTLL